MYGNANYRTMENINLTTDGLDGSDDSSGSDEFCYTVANAYVWGQKKWPKSATNRLKCATV